MTDNTTPTVNEVAVIAATLAGRGWTGDDASQLAVKAIALWYACRSELFKRSLDSVFTAEAWPRDANSPKSFPVPLEDALRYILPNVKHPDRMGGPTGYRAYMEHVCKEAIRDGRSDCPKAEDYIALKNKKGLSEDDFNDTRSRFCAWREQEISKLRSKSGKAGGRPSKRSRKKKIL